VALSIGWFSTGRGEGSRRLLTAAVEAIQRSDLDAEIAFVFCNRERGEYEATDVFLDLVASLRLPVVTLSSRRFRRGRGGALSQPGQPLPPWRVEYDRAVANLIAPYDFDVGMLAGYMLVFTGEVCNRHPLLNLHPAHPEGPVGTWQDVTWQLIDQRAERSGVMIHLATEELDRGPVVTFCTFSLRDPSLVQLWEELGSRSAADVQANEGEEFPLFREIRRRGSARETALVIQTLSAFSQGRVGIDGAQVVDSAGSQLAGGLDLTREIDSMVGFLKAPGKEEPVPGTGGEGT
jgi:folate-dependent phosphoribosylglycinamide formyltransferase PurN